jgi:hypothetical protein
MSLFYKKKTLFLPEKKNKNCLKFFANEFLFWGVKRRSDFHYSLFLVYANTQPEEDGSEGKEEKLNFI